MKGDRVGITKWCEGEQVVWRHGRDGEPIIATVQPGPCTAGAQFVHITWLGHSAVVWQDELRLATDGELTAALPSTGRESA